MSLDGVIALLVLWRMVDSLLSNIASYPILFWLCVITGLAIPVPEDLVLVYAGVMLHHGELDWIPTFTAICAGVWVRDIAAYLIGRVGGDWLFAQPWGQRLFPPARIEKTRQMVTERGLMAVVIGRLLIGMRVPVFLVCGSMRIGFRRFVIVDGIGVVLTTPILIGLGWKFGEPLFEGFRSVMRGTSGTAWALVVTGLVVFVWQRMRSEPENTGLENSALDNTALDDTGRESAGPRSTARDTTARKNTDETSR